MKQHKIQPPDRLGEWTSNYTRYYSYAGVLHGDLTSLVGTLASKRRADASPILSQDEKTPEVVRDYTVRDRCADGIQIFSAMSVEAFLNLYGVVTLGEDVFNKHFERLTIEPKLKQLLLVCNNLVLDDTDELAKVTHRIVKKRNGMVHPKAYEVSSDKGKVALKGEAMPDAANEAWNDCQAFFELFGQAVPEARRFIEVLKDGHPYILRLDNCRRD